MASTPPDPELASARRDHHRALLDVAYRMLGSLSEAEDAVQDAFVRLMRTGTEEVDDPRGRLVVAVSRICLDRLRSAHARRMRYVGPWLPEPIVSTSDGDVADPADRITLDDSVRMALLIVLERLTPAERTRDRRDLLRVRAGPHPRDRRRRQPRQAPDARPEPLGQGSIVHSWSGSLATAQARTGPAMTLR